MKKLFLVTLFTIATTMSMAQTATNFTVNDCNNNPHNLFSELDAGKVIVLFWTMPCTFCTAAALTSYNVVQSYQSSNPNRVYFYLTDDFADTPCASINSWANSIGISQSPYSLRFSNPAINMSDYGVLGMPKIVVVGGSNHTVFYNVENGVYVPYLQDAINAALGTTGIHDPKSIVSSFTVFPNPAANTAEIKFNLINTSDISIEFFNLAGQKLKNIYSGNLSAGENSMQLDVTPYASGMYLVKLSVGDNNKYINLMVSH